MPTLSLNTFNRLPPCDNGARLAPAGARQRPPPVGPPLGALVACKGPRSTPESSAVSLLSMSTTEVLLGTDVYNFGGNTLSLRFERRKRADR